MIGALITRGLGFAAWYLITEGLAIGEGVPQTTQRIFATAPAAGSTRVFQAVAAGTPRIFQS